MSKKNKKLDLDKIVLQDLYINQLKTCNEIAEMFDCTSKSIRNYLNKYNIDIRSNSESVKLERSKWSIEKEQARSKKYMTTWNNKSIEERLEIAKKKTKNINSLEAIMKSRATKTLRNTHTKSKAEDNFYNKLICFIDESDVIRHHFDNVRYNYECDFYIKSKDLFIEYQGHQTHGHWPFDSNNSEHLNYVKDLEKHKFNANIFTIKDPNKLNDAKLSNIKLLLIYPDYDSYFLKDSILYNIGKFDMTKLNELC